MPLVFKTEESAPDAVFFTGVGQAPANGKGGVLVEEASLVLTQLQSPTGVPYEGKELEAAAKALADSIDGLTVANVRKDTTRDDLAREAGFGVEFPDALETARERYIRTYGLLDPDVKPEEVREALANSNPATAASQLQAAAVLDKPDAAPAPAPPVKAKGDDD